LADEIIPGIVDKRYIFPIIIIGFGVAMLFKTLNIFQPKNKNKSTTMFDEDVDMSSDDYISSSVVFGAVEKNVMSKDFKGGEFKTAFGGTEINLTQADIQQPVTIDVSTAFGGLQLIIPSEWEIKSNVTTMFGSIEDKRPSQGTVTSDPNKVVTLQGSCVFGGVEIVSYK
jgi:predicted membrane protein